MNFSKHKISVVIPAYNEENNLKTGVLKEVADYLKSQDYNYEVLVVDDGSTDKTIEILVDQINDYKNFKLIKNNHGGKAITVMTGLLKAQGEVVVFTDMDQATPIKEIEKLLAKFDEGFDIVIGSRVGRKGAPLVRKLAAWGFAAMRNIILGLPFTDTQCGFKGFTSQTIKKVFPDLLKEWQRSASKGSAVNAGFDVEMLYISKKMGLKIAEVPVAWRHVGTERVQLIKDAIEASADMIKLKLNDLKGKYG